MGSLHHLNLLLVCIIGLARMARLGEMTIRMSPTPPSLPFNGRARTVAAVVPVGAIQLGSTNIYELPSVQAEQAGSGSQVKLTWSRARQGSVHLTAHMDNPS